MTTISDFEIIEKIDEGSFGKVYKAKHKIFKNVSAIKKIQIRECFDETKLKRELEILTQLKNKHMVNYITSWSGVEQEYDMEVRYMFIQMDYYPYNLDQIIKMINTVPLNDKREEKSNGNIINYFLSCNLFNEILIAVKFLHEIKPVIIHRDLKPNNILVSMQRDKEGVFVKLCDFGLATYHDALTTLSHTLNQGCNEYMAPEVKDSKYDYKCDIYSLARIGEKLFNVKSDDPDDFEDTIIMKAKRNLKKILCRMLAFEPKERPSCQEVLDSKKWTITTEKFNFLLHVPKVMKFFKSNKLQFIINYLSHLISEQKEQNKTKINEIKGSIKEFIPINKENFIGYEFGLNFKLTQISDKNENKDVTFINYEDNMFMALFDKLDVDFMISINNNSPFTIKFNVKLGADELGKSFILMPYGRGCMKTLESNGKHLHYISQSTEDGTVLTAMSAHKSKVSIEEASIYCSRITIQVFIDKSDDKREYVSQHLMADFNGYVRRTQGAGGLEEKTHKFVTRAVDIKKDEDDDQAIFSAGILTYNKTENSNDVSCLMNKARGIDLKDDYEKECDDLKETEQVQDDIGERGVVCFSRATGQHYNVYDQEFINSNMIIVRGFTLELRNRPKYTL